MAMVVPFCFFVGAETYALAVNFVPWYRNTVDAFTTTEVGLHGRHNGVAGVADAEAGMINKEEEAQASYVGPEEKKMD